MKADVTLEPNIEQTAEYREGWLAWKRAGIRNPHGTDADTRACPYPCGQGMNDRRTRFCSGWWTGYVNSWLEDFEERRNR